MNRVGNIADFCNPSYTFSSFTILYCPCSFMLFSAVIVSCGQNNSKYCDWETLRSVWPRGGTPRKIGWGCAARFPKPLPYIWPRSAIFLPYLWPKQPKNHTLWGRTYLYSPYKRVSPRGVWPGYRSLRLQCKALKRSLRSTTGRFIW